jgi:hypothetical protein
MTQVIFIGDDFYQKSGTRMSSLYRISEGIENSAYFKTDWREIKHILGKGNEIHIRPANESEREFFTNHLAKDLLGRE